jgi:cell fate regulator YaaT (PSP1 superfamily)
MSGCTSCGTANEDKVGGCQNNGTCGTSGCNRLNVFDWLSGMDIPAVDRYDVVEVRFKAGRKGFFRNVNRLDLTTGDAVMVDMPGAGVHMGYVSLMGELVRLQMLKKGVKDDDEITKILRIANDRDIEKAREGENRELPALFRAREVINELNLQMKLSDVEFQADLLKATFFYSAESRVDFRELIKILAGEFKVRIEMRQISLRQEAGRLGGIGSCGRELCCSTWLSDFKSVSTSAARYQNLSLNPAKLSGQCGRLKCCLNYELETYITELKDIPEVKGPLKTAQGEARLQKTDIFRKLMWFSFANDNSWYSIETERVVEIIQMNQRGEVPESLQENAPEMNLDDAGNRDLELLDKKYSLPKKRKKKKKKKGGPGQRMANQGASAPNTGQSKDAQGRNPKQRPGGKPSKGPRVETKSEGEGPSARNNGGKAKPQGQQRRRNRPGKPRPPKENGSAEN